MRRQNCVRWGLGVAGLLATIASQAVTLKTADGLVLEFSATGRVTAAAIGKTALPLTGEGGFAVADFRNQPEPVNLVPNPGFEDGIKGWAVDPKTQTLDTTVFHSGKAAMRLHIAGPEPGRTSLAVTIPAKPLTHYRVGMWVRRHGCQLSRGAPGAYSSFLDDKGNHVGPYQESGQLPKQDDTWAPVAWDVVTVPGTTRLLLRGDIFQTTGTTWLDDFFIYEIREQVYLPVIGTLSPAQDGLAFTSRLPQAGVEIEASLKGGAECLRVDGVVCDTTGEDRALGVRFGLPLDLAGWRWWDDAEDRQTIETAKVYGNTSNGEAGVGCRSLYPWSAVTGREAGLSLALPVSQGPRVFVLQHDQGAPQFSLTFFFGLTKDAGRNPSRAPFSFVLYSHDPAWGMRSAMARYYRLFPESFVKRPTYEGYLNYAGLERFDPATHDLVLGRDRVTDASDFGEGFNFIWHMHGCYDYRQIACADPKMPSDQTVLAWLQKLVEDEKTKPRYYAPTAETIKKLVYDGNGLIRYIFDTQYWRPHEGYNGTDQAGWGLNFRVNEDPGVSSYLATATRKEVEKFAAANPKRRPFDSCFTADAIEGYSGLEVGLNYRREHFRTTLVPLTFGRDNLRPAMPNTIWDFHEQVWHPLTEQYQVITYGNGNVPSCIFIMPYIDLCMVEGRWPVEQRGREERFWRASAHHKLWRFWCDSTEWYHSPADRASVLRHLRNGLGEAIFPAVSALQVSCGDLDAYRGYYRQYVPAFEELSAAGWEPVPYAQADGVVVERFGSFAAGTLHLTLRNYAKGPCATVVQLDRAGLGIPGDADFMVAELPSSAVLLAAFPGAGLRTQVDADGTRAYWIGTRPQAAQRGLRLALYTLGKIERLFATELDDTSRTTLADAQAAATRGLTASAAQALAAAEDLQALAGRLGAELKNKSPVDLAKLLFRLRAQVSLVPVALLELESDASPGLENGPRGGTAELPWGVRAQGPAPLAALAGRVLSPWPDVEAKCRMSGVPTGLARGAEAKILASLAVPVAPPRRLLPYLLELRGRAGDAAFTVALPVDVHAGTPLKVSALPVRVFRGQDRRLMVTVANNLADGARLTLKFSPPPKVKVDPESVAFDLPGKGTAEFSATLVFDQGVTIGNLRVPYAVTGTDARFATDGALALSVCDSVPQLRIRRAQTAPTIDGKLDEAVWQTAPLIPELHLLADGGVATEKTAVWAVYDDRGLYVAVRCRESRMDELVATYTARGSPLYLEDDVEFYILPLGGPRVYQFAVNALGTRSDNSGNEADWTAAAQRGAQEWTVEAFVPYAAVDLGRVPEARTSWGMQFGRQRPRKAQRETTSWTSGAGGFINRERLGEIVFE